MPLEPAIEPYPVFVVGDDELAHLRLGGCRVAHANALARPMPTNSIITDPATDDTA